MRAEIPALPPLDVTDGYGYKEFRESKPAADQKPTQIIFVHGIMSDCGTFDQLLAKARDHAGLSGTGLGVIDYDWRQPIMTSALQVCDTIVALFGDHDVTLVGHSMGGLVSRMALLTGILPNVRRVVMIGTPNHGAVPVSRWNVVGQLALGPRSIFARTLRSEGVQDLSRVQDVIVGLVRGKQIDLTAASETEYITIPGIYYHEERSVFADPATGFADWVLSVTAALADTSRLFAKIRRPHDGIVEESSVAFLPTRADRFNEFSAGAPPVYRHIVPVEARETKHIEIHRHPEIVRMICDLLAAPSATEWLQSLEQDVRTLLSLTPP